MKTKVRKTLDKNDFFGFLRRVLVCLPFRILIHHFSDKSKVVKLDAPHSFLERSVSFFLDIITKAGLFLFCELSPTVSSGSKSDAGNGIVIYGQYCPSYSTSQESKNDKRNPPSGIPTWHCRK